MAAFEDEALGDIYESSSVKSIDEKEAEDNQSACTWYGRVIDEERLLLLYKLILEHLEDDPWLLCRDLAPKRILHFGSGSGELTIDCAEKHPAAEVLGLDPHEPASEWMPPNCEFQVGALHTDLVFRYPFQFICIDVATTMNIQPASTIRRLCKLLSPGGYLQVIYPTIRIECDDGTLEGTGLISETERIEQSIHDWRHTMKYLEGNGLEDLVMRETRWPINEWPEDENEKEAGRVNCKHIIQWLNCWDGKDGLPTIEMQLTRQGVQDTKHHGYTKTLVFSGRKPMALNIPDPILGEEISHVGGTGSDSLLLSHGGDELEDTQAPRVEDGASGGSDGFPPREHSALLAMRPGKRPRSAKGWRETLVPPELPPPKRQATPDLR